MKKESKLANLNDMAVCIAKHEGKLIEVDIGQIKEILKVVCKMVFKNPKLIAAMYCNGEKQCQK